MQQELNLLMMDAVTWAREAGGIQMHYFRTSLHPEAKLNQSDIVTEADKASEEFLLDKIATHYPDHAVLSEESGEHAGRQSGWRWVIDPLDGTTNFNSGLPLFAVSIGIEHDGHTVIGVVYNPATNELFTAVKGQGSLLNGEPIHCRRDSELCHAVVATGFPVDKDVNPDNNLDNLTRVLPKVRGMRRLGAASVDMCYVAAGFLDGYWELNLHEWDVNAAQLIVAEAGGLTKRFRPDGSRNVCMLAASPAIFAQIEPLIV